MQGGSTDMSGFKAQAPQVPSIKKRMSRTALAFFFGCASLAHATIPGTFQIEKNQKFFRRNLSY
jgi:hypothetical protein